MPPVDVAMAHLLRLVLADDWRVVTASARLREVVPDRRLLGRLAASLEPALRDGSSVVAERAALTVRAAITDLAGGGPLGAEDDSDGTALDRRP